DYSKTETILIDAQSIQWVSLYPNPVTDYFALKADESMVIRRVDIYDQKGNLVLSTQEKPFTRINVEKLNAGIYQVKVTGNEGEISIQRMVKK
ncbi:T9SS type A sorting domain-containing protein, partial [Emticicia sp. CRIBPO]|uniref:T9SS type A sorting domain-containing protein n=1 Tax=Emticicia sp. CRIBPO TaxID=2683258 RepID=UPI0014121FED